MYDSVTIERFGFLNFSARLAGINDITETFFLRITGLPCQQVIS